MVSSEDKALSCYGFSTRCDFPLAALRAGGGSETLEIVESPTDPAHPDGEPLFELHDPQDNLSARLYRDGKSFRFWTADTGWYRVEPTLQRIEAPANANGIRREARLWSVPAMLCFIERGDFPLHAAAVEINGKALLFAGPSRVGKTTLALQFHKAGYRVLNEDLSCCRVAPDPLLLPGPASLRVRSDVLEGEQEAPAGTRSLLTQGDRVHLAIDQEFRGNGQPVPIAGICFLRESDRDVRLEPLKGPTVLPDFWSLSFRLPDNAARSRSFTQLTQLAGHIEIWNLYRPLRLDGIGETLEKILELL